MTDALIVHQLSSIGAQTSRQTLNGREYLVAPMVAIVGGVLNGELVPTDEIGKFPEAWNGIPVPLGHPTQRGAFISANSPEIVESQCVGRFWNARMDGDKLIGELWLDIEKAKGMGGDALKALERLENGEPTEVSTAYFRELEANRGTFNGEGYVGIARNLRPDHVALLLNQPGACSWKDGCGCPRVNADEKDKAMTVLKVNYEISLDEQRSQVYTAWSAMFDPEGHSDMWVREVFADHVIVHGPEGLVSYPYERGENGITFGAPVPVRIVYEPVTNRQNIVYNALRGLQSALGFQTLTEEVEMADTNIVGGGVPPQGDAAPCGGCPDKAAVDETPQVNAAAQTPAPAAEMPAEVADLVALARDLGGAEALRSAIQTIQANAGQRKNELVSEIRANERNAFSETELAAMPIDVLQKLAASLRPANYAGRGGVRSNADENQPPAPLPVVMAE